MLSHCLKSVVLRCINHRKKCYHKNINKCTSTLWIKLVKSMPSSTVNRQVLFVTFNFQKNRRLNELERLSKQEDRQAYNLLLEHFRESTRKRSLATSTNGSFSSRLTNNAPRPEVIDLCGSSKVC